MVRLPEATDTGPTESRRDTTARAPPRDRSRPVYDCGVTTALVHEPDGTRYVLYVDGEVAALADYRVQGDIVSFFHTFTQPSRRGQGLAGQVVEFAMDDVEATSTLTVSPDCWYVANWFAKHPDRVNLLQPRR